MSAPNVNIDANSVGARITIALVVLGLVLEVLSDNMLGCNQSAPIKQGDCVMLCASQNDLVERYEPWACVCRAVIP